MSLATLTRRVVANQRAATRYPDTIQLILEQMGGFGFKGVFGATGGSNFRFKCAEPRGEYRGRYASRITPQGCVDEDVAVRFNVNGKPEEDWTMHVSLEPSDTYTVRLTRRADAEEQARGLVRVVLDTREDIYCDQLDEVVDRVYVQALQEHNEGFAPLS